GATELHHFIVREMADREAIASDGSGGKRNRLPGMPLVVQAVSICPVPVLPGLAPYNAGQHKHDRGKAASQLQIKSAERALLGHVRGWAVMIHPIGPPLQAPCEEVEFRRGQISGG